MQIWSASSSEQLCGFDSIFSSAQAVTWIRVFKLLECVNGLRDQNDFCFPRNSIFEIIPSFVSCFSTFKLKKYKKCSTSFEFKKRSKITSKRHTHTNWDENCARTPARTHCFCAPARHAFTRSVLSQKIRFRPKIHWLKSSINQKILHSRWWKFLW